MTKKVVIHHFDCAFRPGEEELLADFLSYVKANDLTQTKAVKQLLKYALDLHKKNVIIQDDRVFVKQQLI
jgi:hypothetical protein